MYNLGIDIGSSSIKVALVEAISGKQLHTVKEPEQEMDIIARKPGWAEQDPELWWKHTCLAIKRLLKVAKINPDQVTSIGIAYQMHGLVVVDETGAPLRNAIIWCDSRAVEIGNDLFLQLGKEKCSQTLLNSPGNFTLSKLRWVQAHEPQIFSKIHKFMLPGDYIAWKLTGKFATTANGLSEGICWDYQENKVAHWIFETLSIPLEITPEIVPNFTNQGTITKQASIETGLGAKAKVMYRAGDQPNNALALNILHPGEVAATAGTSGVLYAVTDTLKTKETVRINSFAHVNYSPLTPNLGKLLCINGTGIQYRWLKDFSEFKSYELMNIAAEKIAIGADGVVVLPFGNGAERMFNNATLDSHICNLNVNIHKKEHVCRATLEGIAFAFVYGMELLKEDEATIHVIRAGNDNLFRSNIFSQTIATLTGHDIEIYNTTGAIGAARAAGVKNGDFNTFSQHSIKNDYLKTYTPAKNKTPYSKAYMHWRNQLNTILEQKKR